MDKITLNFFGSGCELCIEMLSDEVLILFNKINKTETLSNVFFDLDFLENNKIKTNNKEYKSWKDFNYNGTFKGINILESGQLEIWKNKKRIRTIKLSEFIDQKTLFPIFNIKKNVLEIQNNGEVLIVGKQFKGLISKYEFEVENFDIDKLLFNVIDVNSSIYSFSLLNKLIYNNVELNSKKSDTVEIGSVFEIY